MRFSVYSLASYIALSSMEFWGFLLSAMLESRTARGFCDWIAVSAFNISHGLLGPVSYNHQLISFKSFSCPLFMFWCRCCVAVWHDTWWICMHVVSVGLRWGLKEMKTLYSMKNKQTSLLDLFTIELVKHFYTLNEKPSRQRYAFRFIVKWLRAFCGHTFSLGYTVYRPSIGKWYVRRII